MGRKTREHSTRLAGGRDIQVSGELSNNQGTKAEVQADLRAGPLSPKKYYVHNNIFRYQVLQVLYVDLEQVFRQVLSRILSE
jgi:hypothetical protein